MWQSPERPARVGDSPPAKPPATCRAASSYTSSASESRLESEPTEAAYKVVAIGRASFRNPSMNPLTFS